MTILLVSVSTVILVSALCSLFEAVLYSVPISHIESLKHSGHTSGEILHNLRINNIDRSIAAILSLNTIANTGGAFIAGAAFVKVFGVGWSIYFTIFITLSVLLFSEVIPKTIGVIHCRPLSNFIAFPLRFLVWIMAPFVEISRLITRFISHGKTKHKVSAKDIIAMASLGQQDGVFEIDESRMIQNILSLKAKTVRETMTPRTVIFSLSANITAEKAKQEAGIWPYSRVPVYDKNLEDMVGIVLRRDAFNAIVQEQGHTKLSELMQPVHFIFETFTLYHVLEMFLKRRQHLFVVINEFGDMAGILTLEDVLEEILGKEIVDEFDMATDMRELAHRRRHELLKRPCE